jgi:hypothetical protein
MTEEVAFQIVILHKYMRIVRGPWLSCTEEDFPDPVEWSKQTRCQKKPGPDLKVAKSKLTRAFDNQANDNTDPFAQGLSELNRYCLIARKLQQEIKKIIFRIAGYLSIEELARFQQGKNMIDSVKQLTAIQTYQLQLSSTSRRRDADLHQIVSRLCLHDKGRCQCSNIY